MNISIDRSNGIKLLVTDVEDEMSEELYEALTQSNLVQSVGYDDEYWVIELYPLYATKYEGEAELVVAVINILTRGFNGW